MKKYIVKWKPKKGGKVVFRSEVMAPDLHTAPALVGVPAQGEVVGVEEYVQDLYTALAKHLCPHLADRAVRDCWRSTGN